MKEYLIDVASETDRKYINDMIKSGDWMIDQTNQVHGSIFKVTLVEDDE